MEPRAGGFIGGELAGGRRASTPLGRHSPRGGELRPPFPPRLAPAMKTNDQNGVPMASALPAQASAAQRATLNFYERVGGYALTDIGTDADGC